MHWCGGATGTVSHIPHRSTQNTNGNLDTTAETSGVFHDMIIYCLFLKNVCFYKFSSISSACSEKRAKSQLAAQRPHASKHSCPMWITCSVHNVPGSLINAHTICSESMPPYRLSNNCLSPSDTHGVLGLTSSIHAFWKKKPKVILMMATMCLRFQTVCMILRVMMSPFKCKATLHVVVHMLLDPSSYAYFLPQIYSRCRSSYSNTHVNCDICKP